MTLIQEPDLAHPDKPAHRSSQQDPRALVFVLSEIGSLYFSLVLPATPCASYRPPFCRSQQSLRSLPAIKETHQGSGCCDYDPLLRPGGRSAEVRAAPGHAAEKGQGCGTVGLFPELMLDARSRTRDTTQRASATLVSFPGTSLNGKVSHTV